MAEAQNFKNHARFDPLFHFFILPVLLLNIFANAYWGYLHYAQHHKLGVWATVIAIVLFLLAFKARTYPLKVQDRVIRMEERQRLASLVSASELVELESLTMRQYIGLRFASNPELPDLARRAVREKLTEKQIKEAVGSWRADYDRV